MRLLTATIVAGVALSCFGEQPYRHYATKAEAAAAGEVERGWLPSWVPPDASDLHLQGDIDTNRIWLRFRLPSVSRTELDSLLEPLPTQQIAHVTWKRPRGRARWWPRNLVQLQPADDAALNAELFTTTGGNPLYVAFDRASDNVFVWTHRE